MIQQSHYWEYTLRKPQLKKTSQVPLSMEFSRQEQQSGLPFSSPGDLPDLGIKPRSPSLQPEAPSEPPGKPIEKDTMLITALFATVVFSVLCLLGDPLTFNFSDHSSLRKIISIFDFRDHYFSPKEPMDHELLIKIKFCFSLELQLFYKCKLC